MTRLQIMIAIAAARNEGFYNFEAALIELLNKTP